MAWLTSTSYRIRLTAFATEKYYIMHYELTYFFYLGMSITIPGKTKTDAFTVLNIPQIFFLQLKRLIVLKKRLFDAPSLILSRHGTPLANISALISSVSQRLLGVSLTNNDFRHYIETYVRQKNLNTKKTARALQHNEAMGERYVDDLFDNTAFLGNK